MVQSLHVGVRTQKIYCYSWVRLAWKENNDKKALLWFKPDPVEFLSKWPEKSPIFRCHFFPQLLERFDLITSWSSQNSIGGPFFHKPLGKKADYRVFWFLLKVTRWPFTCLKGDKDQAGWERTSVTNLAKVLLRCHKTNNRDTRTHTQSSQPVSLTHIQPASIALIFRVQRLISVNISISVTRMRKLVFQGNHRTLIFCPLRFPFESLTH